VSQASRARIKKGQNAGEGVIPLILAEPKSPKGNAGEVMKSKRNGLKAKIRLQVKRVTETLSKKTKKKRA
jgi:hypothetical protein